MLSPELLQNYCGMRYHLIFLICIKVNSKENFSILSLNPRVGKLILRSRTNDMLVIICCLNACRWKRNSATWHCLYYFDVLISSLFWFFLLSLSFFNLFFSTLFLFQSQPFIFLFNLSFPVAFNISLFPVAYLD